MGEEQAAPGSKPWKAVLFSFFLPGLVHAGSRQGYPDFFSLHHCDPAPMQSPARPRARRPGARGHINRGRIVHS